MKKTIFFFIYSVLISGTGVFAQPKALTLKEAIIGPYSQFRTERLVHASWRPETSVYTWLADSVITGVNASDPENSITILTLSELRNVFDVTPAIIDVPERFPSYRWMNKDHIVLDLPHAVVVYNVVTKKIVTVFNLPDNVQGYDLSPDGQHIVYNQGPNLALSGADNVSVFLTRDSVNGIVNGQIVSRNEFGIDKGTFWSPDGQSLAFYRKDERAVSQYPLVNTKKRVAELKTIRYPMAGMASEKISVLVYHLGEKAFSRLIVTGEPDQYLTSVSWGPGGKFIYLAVLNRDQNHLWFNQYDASTGRFVKTLFEERHKAYVEPLHSARFLPEHPDQFIWESKTSGYNRIYLYDTAGHLLETLTPENADVDGVVGFSDHDRYFAYHSAALSPVERHLFILDRKSGKRTRITTVHGMHRVEMSSDGNYFADSWSNLNTPRKTVLVDRKGKVLSRLLEAENPWKDRKLGRVELGRLPAKDGSPELYYRLIKPVDFDPSKKYPVIIYVYGGPHSQLVTDSWLGQSRMWQHYMAGLGYVSFTLDNRGTMGRGFDFENCIHRQLGKLEVADQMRGVKFLKSLPYIDTSRMGVHGWSYGGFMTLSMMLRHPGVFRVAVAGGPVTDWKYYEVMYGERYMDKPQQNPEGYREADLKNVAGNLSGKCLIIHGAMDSTVVWQHSLTLLHAFIKAGKQVDYFVYPDHPHNVRGYDRIHLMRKVSDYFEEYLKAAPE